MYMIPDNLLGKFRKDVVDKKRGAEIGKIAAAIRAHGGFCVEGRALQTGPGGLRPGHPNAELLKHNGLYASFTSKVPGSSIRRASSITASNVSS